jgi:hypothetical protein
MSEYEDQSEIDAMADAAADEYHDQQETDAAVFGPKLISAGPIEPGDIIFAVRNGAQEMLRLCGNGDIMVKGNLATNDLELVESFHEFITMAKPKLNREELRHAIDHALSDLDILDYELEDHVADHIKAAIGQLKHIRDVLLC